MAVLSCSLLQRNVPNRQLYRWSNTVMRNSSLNSKAAGNCSQKTTEKDPWLLHAHVHVWSRTLETDLSSHLPNAVDELDEERRALRVGVVLIAITHPLQHGK